MIWTGVELQMVVGHMDNIRNRAINSDVTTIKFWRGGNGVEVSLIWEEMENNWSRNINSTIWREV